ncbi:MAG: glycoside hydrolase family 88 protein [Blastocatellia bacterium]
MINLPARKFFWSTAAKSELPGQRKSPCNSDGRAQGFQRSDGLWSVFVDEPKLAPNTAGSAGVAAALAIGAQQGWLGQDARTAAERCLAGLKPHLTLDGFLSGVAQANKGGESLQRGDYRVIYQMAMGLMAQ